MVVLSIGSVCMPPVCLYASLYICIAPVHPYAPYPLEHLYVLPMPYVLHMSWGLSWTSVHSICLGVFWVHQYIFQAFLCLSGHPFPSQFITDILVAPHHCRLLLYWTGWLWISAMLHAVVPFFVVFIMSQASTTTAMTTTPVVTVVCCGTLSLLSTVTMAPWLMGLPAISAWCGSAATTDTKALWGCCWPCHCAAAAASISDASSGLCQLCHGSSTYRFLF